MFWLSDPGQLYWTLTAAVIPSLAVLASKHEKSTFNLRQQQCASELMKFVVRLCGFFCVQGSKSQDVIDGANYSVRSFIMNSNLLWKVSAEATKHKFVDPTTMFKYLEVIVRAEPAGYNSHYSLAMTQAFLLRCIVDLYTAVSC